MARITLGIGTSHGPLLSTPPEEWRQRVEADKRNPELYYRGLPYTFDQLVELRRDQEFDSQITPEKSRMHYEACQAAIARLAKVFGHSQPDVAVIIGDDQEELFLEDNMPALLVYWGEQ